MPLKSRVGMAWAALTQRSSLATIEASSVAQLLKQDSRPPDRGTAEVLKAYSYSPWLRAISSKVAFATATTAWHVYARNGGTSKQKWRRFPTAMKHVDGPQRRQMLREMKAAGEIVEVEEHPFLTALYAGNAYFGGVTALQVTQLYIDLVGEAFWIKVKASDAEDAPVVQYWLIPPTWVKSTPTNADPYFKIGENEARVDPEQMVWFYHPALDMPYDRGTGIARTLADELDTDEFAAKHVRQFFFNSARPDLLVIADGLEREDVRRIENEWNHKLRSVWAKHKAFFLNRKVDVKEIGSSLKDMGMVELRQFERDVCMQVWGFPPELLGVIENSNRATIDSADYLFAKWVIEPRQEFLRERFQREIEAYDPRLFVDFDSKVSEDEEALQKWAQVAPWSRTLDQWRAAQGLDPMEQGGDQHPVPIGIRLVRPGEPAVLSIPGRKAPDDKPRGNAIPIQENASSGPSRATQVHSAECSCCSEDECGQAGEWATTRAIAGGDSILLLMEEYEAGMIEQIMAAFADLRGAVDMDAFFAAIKAGDVEKAMAVLEVDSLPGYLGSAVETLQEAYAVAGTAYAEELGEFFGLLLDFNIENPEAVAWLETHGAEMVQGVTDATRESIKNALVKAYEQGLTGAEASREIAEELADKLGLTDHQRKALDNYAEALVKEGRDPAEVRALVEKYKSKLLRDRANTIARNELVDAGNKSLEACWDEAIQEGLIDPDMTEREWIITVDACRLCAPMAGERTTLKGSWTMPNGKTVFTPSDAHIQCRCTQGLVFK